MSAPLWTAPELMEATGGTIARLFAATGVSIDTRTLQPGDLFIALQGEGRDGHAFVGDALRKGAAGAMVEQDVLAGGPLLLVDDTLAALARLGAFARARSQAQVVAVTGSVGKTTTKEMLRGILSDNGPTHAAVASYNNHWGLPLTLARLPAASAFCVAEIGMNHAGEIAPLAQLARPHVAVITNIEKAHIGHLGSIEAIADEKASIMRGLVDDGTAILPMDSPMFPRLRVAAEGASILTFGATDEADARLVHIEAGGGGSLVQARVVGMDLVFRLQAPGRHMALNAVAALLTAAAMGLDPASAAKALERFVPIAGRGLRRAVVVSGGEILLLDESYNGNGASMRAALEVLRLQPGRRHVAVLGDMLELGEAGPSEHAALAPDVARSADLVFTCGKLMRHLSDALPGGTRAVEGADAASLAPIVAAALRPGDVVLVKGSLGSRMSAIVHAIEALGAEQAGAA